METRRGIKVRNKYINNSIQVSTPPFATPPPSSFSCMLQPSQHHPGAPTQAQPQKQGTNTESPPGGLLLPPGEAFKHTHLHSHREAASFRIGPLVHAGPNNDPIDSRKITLQDEMSETNVIKKGCVPEKQPDTVRCPKECVCCASVSGTNSTYPVRKVIPPRSTRLPPSGL